MSPSKSLPDGWIETTFGAVVSPVSVNDKKIPRSEYLESARFPVIDQGQQFIGGYSDDETKVISEDLPLLVFGDHTRAFKYLNQPFIPGADGIKVLKPKGVDPKWLYQIAHALDLPDKGYARHYQHLKAAKLFVPPLSEQRRIVAEIEQQFTRLDAGVAALRRTQANLKRYRAAVLKTAFTRTKDDSEKPWPTTTLGAVAKTSSGGTPKRGVPEYYNGSIPWVKSGELGDQVVTEAAETITAAGVANSSAKIFPKGTLCVALYGATVGKLGILGMDAATNQAVCGIFLPSEIDIRFAYRFLESQRRQLIESAKGGAQPNISQEIVRNLEIPMPPLAEQKRIIAEVERCLSVVDELGSVVKANLQRATRLRQSILRRAFHGNPDLIANIS